MHATISQSGYGESARVVVLAWLSGIFLGGEIGDAKFLFTASFDEKSGKFRVISKKKLHPDVKKKD